MTLPGLRVKFSVRADRKPMLDVLATGLAEIRLGTGITCPVAAMATGRNQVSHQFSEDLLDLELPLPASGQVNRDASASLP